MKKVSICVLAYKTTYLDDVLETIFNQTYKNISIEIRDDCSPEKIGEFCKQYLVSDDRLRYIRNKRNLTEFYSWIEAVKACESEYLLTVHDDDVLSPLLVEKELGILEKYPEVAAVSGFCYHVDELGEVCYKRNRSSDNQQDKYFKPMEYIEHFATELVIAFTHMAMMVRVKDIQATIDSLLNKVLCDTSLILTINSKHSIYLIDEDLVGYRQHKGQVTNCLEIYNRYNPSKQFDYVYELTEHFLGRSQSRKVFGWARNYSIQYDLLNLYYNQLQDLVIYMLNCFDKSMNIHAVTRFALQLLYLKEKSNKNMKYKIWGAGVYGKSSKKIIETMLPDFTFTGYIDKNIIGELDGWETIKPDEYDFLQPTYIFICHNRDNSGFESAGELAEMGLKTPNDFMLGYGFRICSHLRTFVNQVIS